MEGQTKLSAGQIGILINARIKDMAMWLMEDFKYSLEEALDCVYNSELFEKLQDLETGLYYQSSGYNYELLKEEMKYECYGAEHLLSLDDAVDDLAVICHRHGGALV